MGAFRVNCPKIPLTSDTRKNCPLPPVPVVLNNIRYVFPFSSGNYDAVFESSSKCVQGGFFNCSHPKISKYKKKSKYPNCSHVNSSEMSQYGKNQNIVAIPH